MAAIIRAWRAAAADRGRNDDANGDDGAALARHDGVRLAPTALFVGPGGRELAARLVGAGVSEYYAGEVDQALRTAASALHPGN